MGLFTKDTKITNLIDQIVKMKKITNWETVESLCQYVNSSDSDDGPKEASRAIRRWIKDGNPQQHMNIITVIQGLVNGCGSKFKAQLSSPKLIVELQELIYSGYTNVYVRARLVERIGAWSVEYAQDPSMQPIVSLYKKLTISHPVTLVALNQSPYPHRQNSIPVHVSPQQRMMQIHQDIELAINNAQMLVEAVSFADPEVDAIEENELIKEFHSKCLTLHRGIQNYLTEVTNSSTPDEKCLASLLNCNQELLVALSSHDQMLERSRESKALKATNPVITVPINSNQASPRVSLESVEDELEGAGVGSSRSYGKSKSTDSYPIQETTDNPFDNEHYYIPNTSDIANSIKIGKQPVYNRNTGNDSDDESDEEKLMIKRMKEHSLLDETKKGSSSSSVPVSAQ